MLRFERGWLAGMWNILGAGAILAAILVSVHFSIPGDPANAQSLPMGPIEGTVTDANGTPIQGARITVETFTVVTGADGLFALDPASLDADAVMRVSASGYRDVSQALDFTTNRATIVLEQRSIYALYLNPAVTTSDAQIDNLIDIINTTNANAVVIDIKEEWVWYDTSVAFFQDAGTVRPVYDLSSLLQKFHDNNIYTIARLVTFKDSTVAEVHPDLAIRSTETGGPWRDMNDVAWVNPMLHELWQPNIDLAVEAARNGFDEIQYDYVRFPTDGDLSTMDFGVEFNQESRQAAIEGFLAESRAQLEPIGAKQSADVFGFTMVVDDDLGIGQNFVNLANYVDYLSPMVYPSHYSDGQFGLPGHPNDFPYEIVDISLRDGIEQLGGKSLQIRPWLQDFDLYGMTPYGSEQVRAQIQAANEHGTSGWMLWDPENRYRTGNLDPEEAGPVPNPENAMLPGSSLALNRRRTPRSRR